MPLLYGLSAYIIWGFIPVYFRTVSDVPSFLVLCHRIVWSGVVIAGIVTARREWGPIMGALKNPRTVVYLCAGALLIGANWLTFIYAVASRQLLQASLGYFLTPLLSIALGMIFFREKLRSGQWIAVGIAAVAVVNMAAHAVGLPWIALALAGSFGFYGMVRKRIDINSLHGLLVESAVLLPIAALALYLLPRPPLSYSTLGLLSLSGVITAVPLLLFGAAVRRLKLSTLGFLQYVGPTLQFGVATVLFREPLDSVKLRSFALCWAAIGVYVAESCWRRVPQPVADEPE
jgi:chloramphenicol-sensitive protein RarD